MTEDGIDLKIKFRPLKIPDGRDVVTPRGRHVKILPGTLLETEGEDLDLRKMAEEMLSIG